MIRSAKHGEAGVPVGARHSSKLPQAMTLRQFDRSSTCSTSTHLRVGPHRPQFGAVHRVAVHVGAVVDVGDGHDVDAAVTDAADARDHLGVQTSSICAASSSPSIDGHRLNRPAPRCGRSVGLVERLVGAGQPGVEVITWLEFGGADAEFRHQPEALPMPCRRSVPRIFVRDGEPFIDPAVAQPGRRTRHRPTATPCRCRAGCRAADD